MKHPLFGRAETVSNHGTAQGIIPRFQLQSLELAKMASIKKPEDKVFEFCEYCLDDLTNFYDIHQLITNKSFQKFHIYISYDSVWWMHILIMLINFYVIQMHMYHVFIHLRYNMKNWLLLQIILEMKEHNSIVVKFKTLYSREYFLTQHIFIAIFLWEENFFSRLLLIWIK